MSVLLALVGVNISQGSALAAENLVVNGSFEEPAIDFLDYPASIPGWKFQEGSSLELQHGIGGKPYEGEQLAEMDGNAVSGIYQDIPTKPGNTYKLTFAFTPRPNVADNKLNVNWGKTSVAKLDKSGEGLSEPKWQLYTYEVPALCSTTRLSFDDLNETSDGLGSYIDAVSVVEKPGATTSNILANGSFEKGTGNGTGSIIANWTLTGGSDTVVRVDWAGDKFDTYSKEGSFVAPFNRAGKPPQGVLSQSFATIPGAKYDLTFYSYENGDNGAASSKAQVQVNGKGTLVDRTVEATSKSWQKSTYSFVADSPSATLRFSDRSTGRLDSTDWVLDNVSVTLAANQPGC
jgi:hypothetical protein